MSRKPRVQRTPEEKWQIVLEGLKSGNVAETCRKYEIAPTLYYRWKDEVEEGAKAALGGRSAAAPVARTTSRSLPPAARNRLTVSVAWSGGWDGITGWWSTASGSCVSCENADC